jgi:hypothetical protein
MPALTFRLAEESTMASMAPEVRDEFMRTWAPPGAGSWHIMSIELEPDSGGQNIEASVVIPGADSWDLGEARVSRIGGRTPQDLHFRHQLFSRIGSATVAGGRIEAAMKRLILHMSGTLEPRFADSNELWSKLDKKLRQAAADIGERAADVIKVLDWGQDNNVRDIRNDIVHAYWWDYSGVGITRGRVHMDGTSEMILISLEQFEQDCAKLEAYADMLDSAMDGLWLNIYLPRQPAHIN